MGDRRYYSSKSSDGSVSHARDRRRACRYRVGLADGSLGWWQDSTFVNTACRIIDISVAGCLVESCAAPNLKEHQSVWLHPLGVSTSDWTEGIIVDIRKPLFRRCQIRMRFSTDLPYESFKPLAFGVESAGETAVREAPEHEQDDFWR